MTNWKRVLIVLGAMLAVVAWGGGPYVIWRLVEDPRVAEALGLMFMIFFPLMIAGAAYLWVHLGKLEKKDGGDQAKHD